jgi:hypothetical protein
MIIGTHILLHSVNADADRAFLRDVLSFPSIDVGGGWLIFGLPPAEIAVHPGDGDSVQRHTGDELLGAAVYFMCDDLSVTISSLESKGASCSEIQTADWGRATTIALPSGGRLGLYQPLHPTMLQAP